MLSMSAGTLQDLIELLVAMVMMLSMDVKAPLAVLVRTTTWVAMLSMSVRA